MAFDEKAIALAAADVLNRSADAIEHGFGNKQLVHAAAMSAANAKAIVDKLAMQAGSKFFDVGGVSVAKRDANLDGYWRNARTIASRNPATYKSQAIAKYYLTDTELPGTKFFRNYQPDCALSEVMIILTPRENVVGRHHTCVQLV